MTLPVSFDGANTEYIAETAGSATFSIVDNPAPGGTNNSASKVGSIANAGAAWEGIFSILVLL